MDLHLGLFPAWFAAPARDWPKGMELVGFPFYEPDTDLSPELRAFLKQGSKPFVFTPSSANWHVRSFFVESLRACEMGEFRGRLHRTFEPNARRSASTIFATEWTPFGSLFDAAAAVVHPAAIGTGALAIRAGIPQLLIPLAHDQFDNAARFVKLGVARLLSPGRYKAKAVVRELRLLVLDSDVRNNTCALQERLLREPKAEEVAANLIGDFIRRRGPQLLSGAA